MEVPTPPGSHVSADDVCDGTVTATGVYTSRYGVGREYSDECVASATTRVTSEEADFYVVSVDAASPPGVGSELVAFIAGGASNARGVRGECYSYV